MRACSIAAAALLRCSSILFKGIAGCGRNAKMSVRVSACCNGAAAVSTLGVRLSSAAGPDASPPVSTLAPGRSTRRSMSE